MIDVKLKGVPHGIAAAPPCMKEQMSGHFINVSSVYGHKLDPAATFYCATKFAVRALSAGLRQEAKPYNIRTTVIWPGGVTQTSGLSVFSRDDLVHTFSDTANVPAFWMVRVTPPKNPMPSLALACLGIESNEVAPETCLLAGTTVLPAFGL